MKEPDRKWMFAITRKIVYKWWRGGNEPFDEVLSVENGGEPVGATRRSCESDFLTNAEDLFV